MKCFIIIYNSIWLQKFPFGGKPTYVERKLSEGQITHKIEQNTEYWIDAINQINSKQAYLSIRIWENVSFKSKQKELMRLYELNYDLITINGWKFTINGSTIVSEPKILKIIAREGMTAYEFSHVFKDRFDGIIIHFSKFKYNNYNNR